jgi:glycosyltransferase involved in cell wall biosynthesis
MRDVRDPLVSVIMPNYNYSKYIGDAIESVLEQTYRNLELIVVDDGSTDDSVQIISSFGSKVKILHNSKLGPSAARNSGVKASEGIWLAFIDSDDVWLPHKLETQMSFLLSRGVEIVSCRYRKFGHSAKGEVVGPALDSFNYTWFEKNPTSNPFPPSTAVLSRKLLLFAGEWRTELARSEDFDFFRRCAKFGEIKVLEDVMVHYREHEEQISRNSVEQLQSNVLAVKYLIEDLGTNSRWHPILIFLRVFISYFRHALKYRDLELLCKLMRLRINLRKVE